MRKLGFFLAGFLVTLVIAVVPVSHVENTQQTEAQQGVARMTTLHTVRQLRVPARRRLRERKDEAG